MSNEQLLLALKKISFIVRNLDERLNQLENDNSPIMEELSNLRRYISLLEKVTEE